jgi:hypothetical protein
MSRATDFPAAVAALPARVPALHRGRDPRVGLDCAGLLLWVYRAAGAPFDAADRPYGRRDALRIDLSGVVGGTGRFADVTAAVAGRLGDADGDVWVIDGRPAPHYGVQVGGLVYHMTDELHRTAAAALRPRVARAFRLLPPV